MNPSFFALKLSTARSLGLMATTCLVWAAVSFGANANLDGYHDMLENYAWSQPLLWGTHKHPPFFAWVVGGWFSVFPQTDWAYRLLSYVNVAVGLCGVWVLGQRLQLGRLAAWGALLLLWSFPYTTLAGKFNANSQLLSLWPWAAALLLASWQEKGLRGWSLSVALGLVAAACMLSKYYSGVFLAGLLVPTLLHIQGRQWLCTPRPYVALIVFALALLPHTVWMAQHDWAPMGYAMSQGDGQTIVWRHVVRFALSPLFYWLPAWLAVAVLYALTHARQTGVARSRTIWRFLGQSWQPQGWDDVLFWLAWMPWALTLGFGIAGMVELSTPWAIPIGYAFALLWLRNLNALSPQVTGSVLVQLYRVWGVVLVLIVVLGGITASVNALKRKVDYYRPTQQAAVAIVQAWQERYPGQSLQWVGGAWAESAMLAFYAQPQLQPGMPWQTVPGMPDSYPAVLAGMSSWRSRHGMLLCPLGPTSIQSMNAAALDSACVVEARQWLQARGLSEQRHDLSIERSGWRFPRPMVFGYVVFDVPAQGHQAHNLAP